MKIWIVWANNGEEYEDHYEYPVAYYTNRSAADAHKRRAEEFVQQRKRSNQSRWVESPFDDGNVTTKTTYQVKSEFVFDNFDFWKTVEEARIARRLRQAQREERKRYHEQRRG
jgi:hypothetical protein